MLLQQASVKQGSCPAHLRCCCCPEGLEHHVCHALAGQHVAAHHCSHGGGVEQALLRDDHLRQGQHTAASSMPCVTGRQWRCAAEEVRVKQALLRDDHLRAGGATGSGAALHRRQFYV